MKWAAFLCFFAFWLPGCFDPLVGTECGLDGATCIVSCTTQGGCAIDGGIDQGGLDLATGGAEEAGVLFGPIDGPPSLDTTASLDKGYDGAAGAIDLASGEAGKGSDLGRGSDAPLDRPSDAPSDRPSDPIADKPAADRQDGSGPDTSDAAQTAWKDAVADSVADRRDAGAPDTRDAPALTTPDSRDALDTKKVSDAVDSPQIPADGKKDSADTGQACTNCTDVKDAADLPQPPSDTAIVRLDVATSESGPEAGAEAGTEAGPEAQPDLGIICPAEQVNCDGICVDLQTSQTNCGLCRYDCSPRACVQGQCQTCPDNQILCSQRCVDTQADPANCGGCGQVCTSGLCRFGVCKTTAPGHIVVIGHDFQNSNAAMNRLLGNAIFLPSIGDVRFAEYVGVANSTAVNNSHVAISQVSSTIGRGATRTQVTQGDIATQLSTADVFLIQSQGGATNKILNQLGQGWATVLNAFVHTGGVIVVLDASYPINSGTSQILVQAGLLTISATATISNETCTIKAAADPLAAFMPATYTCLPNSIAFSGDGTRVVEDLGQAVVLHVTF